MSSTVSAADVVAIVVSAGALLVAILAARYARRQAVSSEDQAKTAQLAYADATDTRFRLVHRLEGSATIWALENIGNTTARSISATVSFDRSGRDYGTFRFVRIDPNEAVDLHGERPLPHAEGVVDMTGDRPRTEYLAVHFLNQRGKWEDAKIPFVTGVQPD